MELTKHIVPVLCAAVILPLTSCHFLKKYQGPLTTLGAKVAVGLVENALRDKPAPTPAPSPGPTQSLAETSSLPAHPEIVMPASAADAPEDASALVTRALEAEDAADRTALLLAAVDARPDADVPRFLLAVEFQRAGQLDDSEAEYLECLAIHERDFRTHFKLGQVRLRQGRYADALGSFHAALEFGIDDDAGQRAFALIDAEAAAAARLAAYAGGQAAETEQRLRCEHASALGLAGEEALNLSLGEVVDQTTEALAALAVDLPESEDREQLHARTALTLVAGLRASRGERGSLIAEAALLRLALDLLSFDRDRGLATIDRGSGDWGRHWHPGVTEADTSRLAAAMTDRTVDERRPEDFADAGTWVTAQPETVTGLLAIGRR